MFHKLKLQIKSLLLQLRHTLLPLLYLSVCLRFSLAQCPAGSSISFEKLSNVNIRGVNLVPLYTGQQEHLPVSAECNNRCRAAPNCRAFIINYSKHSCVGLGYDSEANGLSMVTTDERTSYFDKICLSISACEKAWTFERVIGKHLEGHDDRILPGVVSRLRCQEHCLKERDFNCKSGEYDHATQQCRLSREDRRTQPNRFGAAASTVDYFENQCAHSLNRLQQLQQQNFTVNNVSSRIQSSDEFGNEQCGFRRMPALDLRRADLLRVAATEAACEQLCRATKAFVCRSFTYEPATSKCWLNSDDSVSAGGDQVLLPTPARLYFERTQCANLRLSCESEGYMELELQTLEPFSGRIYARDDPQRCETFALGTTLNRLRLPLPSSGDNRISTTSVANNMCGVQQEQEGRYSSTVVIQYHPLIQRKGDRLVRVVCNLRGGSQVVSSGYQLLATANNLSGGNAGAKDGNTFNGEPTTTVVNGSAANPHVLLRITDLQGLDVQGAKLGQQLQLRIERLDEPNTAAMHMQATQLVAMSSTSAHQIILIDQNGCPTDPTIFPSLENLSDGRTLVGRFDAFKFADDVVVRFQVNVHFCVGQCKPIQCNHPQHQSRKLNLSNTTEPAMANKSHSVFDDNEINLDRDHHSLLPPSGGGSSSSSSSEEDSSIMSNDRQSGATVSRLFSRRKRSNFHNGLVESRSPQLKIRTHALPKAPADAELRREIIVQGLSKNEEDNAAKLLYNRNLADDVCVSRSSIFLFSLLAALVQLMISLFCCICCARRHTRYVNSPALPSHTSLGRCKVPTDTWSGPGRRPLPAPLSHYFNRID